MKLCNCCMCILLLGMLCVPAYAAMSDYSITRNEVIFDESESLNPCPVKADNGDLICTLGETGDAAPGGRLLFVRSTNDGATWNETPYLIMTSRHGAVGSIFGYVSKAPNGNIVLAVTDVNASGPTYAYTSDIKIYVSTDNGQTFPLQPLATLPTNPVNGNWPSAPVRFLSNGDWILPGYYRDNVGGVDFPCGFWRSTNSGTTWTTHELAFPSDYRAFNEIDIVARADNSLLAVVRTDVIDSGFEYAKGQLFYAESFDQGHTWTAPQLVGIPGHSPSLIRWSDGSIMLGCRRLSLGGNFTSVYIAENGVNFQFAFNAVEPRGNRNSATGYPIFTQLNSYDIYMGFYAGDTTLQWTTYSAGNVIHNVYGITGCGDWGYLKGDLDRNCRVNFKDFAVLAQNWLLPTNQQ
ncbi:MAG: sialidase family protein [Sedimentisphaerales bacterium]